MMEPRERTKVCWACGLVKPLPDFARDAGRSDGYGSECKVCMAARARAYRQANPEKVLEADRRYRQKNHERLLEHGRQRRAANREELNEQERRWREANRERRNETARRWRQANLDKVREADRRWAAAHPDKVRAMRAVKSEENRKRLKASRERDKFAVFAHYGTLCACCGSTQRLEIDHIDGRGAEHRKEVRRQGATMYSWLVKNGFPLGFQTLCKPCNRSKGRGERCTLSHPEPTGAVA